MNRAKRRRGQRIRVYRHPTPSDERYHYAAEVKRRRDVAASKLLYRMLRDKVAVMA